MDSRMNKNCRHGWSTEYHFEILNGPFVEAYGRYKITPIRFDIRDVCYIKPSARPFIKCTTCNKKWTPYEVTILIKGSARENKIELMDGQLEKFQEHWQYWHNKGA